MVIDPLLLSATNKTGVRRKGALILTLGVLAMAAAAGVFYAIVQSDPQSINKGLMGAIGLVAMSGVIAVYTGLFYVVTGLPVNLSEAPTTREQARNRVIYLLGFMGLFFASVVTALWKLGVLG